MKICEFNNTPMIRKDVERLATKYAKATATYHDRGGSALCLLDNTLARMGWKRLGRGSASVAYLHPKVELVLKINIRPDPAYDEFVKIIHAHPNIHFPKISDVKQLTSGKFVFNVYLMERLYELNNSYAIAKELESIACFEPDQDIPDLTEPYTTLVSVGSELYRAAEIIRECRNSVTGKVDIHSGNIMQRRDRTIVIFDPYYDRVASNFGVDPKVKE